MSAGFFGNYFKRRNKAEEEPAAPSSPSVAGAKSSGPEEDPRAAAPASQSDFLKYGLRGRPPAEPETSKEGGEKPRYRTSSVIEPRPEASASRAPAPEPMPAAPAAQTPVQNSPEAASPLDALMQDRVVAVLLQEDLISMPQALIALRQQKHQPGAALWRVLAGMTGIDRDAVFAEAAGVQGFETAHISEMKPSGELVEAVQGLFAPAIGEEMFRLSLLPYEFALDPATRHHTLVFATHDPSHPAIAAFIRKLNLHVELRYASESVVMDRINRVLRKEAELPEQQAAEASTGGKKQQEKQQEPPPVAREKTLQREQEAEAELDFDLAAEGFFEPGQSPLQPGGLSYEDLLRAIQTDVQPGEDVLIEDRIEPARPEVMGGDGQIDLTTGYAGAERGEAEAPEKGGASGDPPALQRTDWTGNPGSGDPPPDPKEKKQDPPANIDLAALEQARSKDRVVAMLLRKEIVAPEQVIEAQQKQKKENAKEALWRVLAQLPDIDREAVFAEAARVYAFPAAKLDQGPPDPEFARSVVETFAEERREELFKLRILPFECDLEQQTGAIKLVFVTHDPTRPEVHRLMQQLKLERFELRYAPESVVTAAIAEAFPRRNEFLDRISANARAYDLGMNYDEKSGLIDEDALEAEISRSTLINLFEATLVEAVRQGASDVHIYPNADKKVEIHFRVDGRLHLWHTEDKVHPEALLAVIKDNATNVDRFERDAAQDGFIQRWVDEALIRFRVSVLPIANASQELRSESIVIRVLDDRKVITDLSKLGLLGSSLERFEQAIHQPHGMVILTGPTGSGKSTTLVAALHQVVSPEVNVLTVEDPVEYIIPDVRQIKLNHKLGLEDALRSILRHDPDVVMVGEMRDRHTAELAIKLANTGHLTFSTLHTNDAPAAISRLYKMGIEPFLIAYAINLVVAQRLIRTLCSACKEVEDDPDPVQLSKLGFSDHEIETTTIYRPGHNESCKSCKGMGYRGRRAVTEALYFSRSIRHMIVEADKMIDEGAIRDQAVKEGMLTLRDSAREIVKMGETSIPEMIRVVTTES